jgi:hypothetical protein
VASFSFLFLADFRNELNKLTLSCRTKASLYFFIFVITVLIMGESNATILIPDISGFTEFMTSTELGHSAHAIHILIDSIIDAVGDEYEVAEVEGDAILLIRKGSAPSQKDIVDICLKMFNAFHFRRKWMQQHTICPCGACQAIINLSLKFVAHHGPLAEMKVGRFVKHSGTDMIVAHRLLKNRIDSNEYLLMTEKLVQAVGPLEQTEMDWARSSEEYASIGKVDYRFTLLNEAKKNVPEPPALENSYHSDNSSYTETVIAANFLDVYMVIMNIPGRPEWIHGLQSISQDGPDAYIGSTHRCKFDDFETVISPLRMIASDEGIVYAERCRIEEMNLSLIYEYVFRKTDDDKCRLSTRFLNAGESSVSAEILEGVSQRMQQMVSNLKDHCENQLHGVVAV